MTTLRIVLAQINPVVGDIEGNLQKHIAAAQIAKNQFSADVIVFPELGITGYPPEDLLLRADFLAAANQALQKFVHTVQDIYTVISHPLLKEEKLYNTCSLTFAGEIQGTYTKQHLPNYSVFDEHRYFVPGTTTCVTPIKGVPTGLVICEDLWFHNPTHRAAEQGARLILSPNASPFELDKHERRFAVLTKRAQHDHIPIVYVNNVGAQDGIVFDGGSMVIDDRGEVCQFAGSFNETLLPVDITFTDTSTQIACDSYSLLSKTEKIYQALILGLRDYVEKNHFRDVLIGVSGGIDSALTLAIAVDALGKDRVTAVLMPSRFTADISIEDALLVAQNLGVKTETISIEPAYERFLEMMQPVFHDKKTDVTEENIQSRCRAIILMALSNKYKKLVLTTGNRSELAVGYCTLYGDMAGGYAVLKDVYKTTVYELAEYRNQLHPVIPKRTITRPPTAELAANQKDEDLLPPYPILDKILEYYLNEQQSIEEIIAQGFDAETVKRIVHLIRCNEYKRRQSPVGTRINHKAFGKDRRYPITNGFKG